jgi:hypothetical protein
MSQDLGNLLKGVRNRDRFSLARALSLLERYPDVAHLLPRERGGHATVVGVAGRRSWQEYFAGSTSC